MSRTYIHIEKAKYDGDLPEKLFRRYLNHANRWNYSRDECRRERKAICEKIQDKELLLEIEEWYIKDFEEYEEE